jgi:hypothetical protein
MLNWHHFLKGLLMTDPQAPPVEQPDINPQPAQPTPPVDVTEVDEPPATTAGEEDHGNPDDHRGDDADAPADTGTPPQGD